MVEEADVIQKGKGKSMIRVTIWYEKIQEAGAVPEDFFPGQADEEARKGFQEFITRSSQEIKEVYPKGVMGTVAEHLMQCEDMQVTSVDMFMPECGLPDELLDNTDVLIWWAHIAHDAVPDSLVRKIRDRVLKGMGFIPLHSAHPSKPLQALLGTSGSLKWRDGDYCRLWNINPTHPIAQGIPESIELPGEEMYGEFFDIPKPDDIVFLGWYRGGEVFRSGCTWTRGYGKIFYFQPGHETGASYHNPYVMKIIENAVRWAAPVMWRTNFDCPNVLETPESKVR